MPADPVGRIRSLKPEAMRNRLLARVPPDVRWTFAAMWCFCDDEGRCQDDARLIKADVYPLDDITAAEVESHLARLADVGLICRYESGGASYLHVLEFRGSGDFGQRPQKPQDPRCPPCDITHSGNGQVALFDLDGSGTRPLPDRSRTGRVPVSPVVVGEGSSRGDGASRTGTRLPPGWTPPSDLDAWVSEHAPDVNLTSELDKFRDYWAGRPGAGGRKSDWVATWRNWLRRAQDDAAKRAPARQESGSWQ